MHTDLSTVSLAVFDVDGTLVDSQHGIVQAMGEAFVAANLPNPNHADVRRVVGLKLESAVAQLLPEPDWDLAHRVADLYRDAFVALRGRLDYHEPLYPGALEALKALERSGITLGVATGKNRRGLMITLEKHRLTGLFSTLKTADDGPGKPDPAMLRAAMNEVGAAAEETVMIGDTVYDMAMARDAAAHALGVSWGYHETSELSAAGALRILETFDDLAKALDLADGVKA
ncbi:MAG: HAD-IA family hydrolase [Rhodovibrionaceae bacterium]|nr:HAD-IA family hydrolase [Rhodovibrionaceae bacterium]